MLNIIDHWTVDIRVGILRSKTSRTSCVTSDNPSNALKYWFRSVIELEIQLEIVHKVISVRLLEIWTSVKSGIESDTTGITRAKN